MGTQVKAAQPRRAGREVPEGVLVAGLEEQSGW